MERQRDIRGCIAITSNCRNCVLALNSVFFFESSDASSRVDNLLLAGKERVAYRANFDVQIFFQR